MKIRIEKLNEPGSIAPFNVRIFLIGRFGEKRDVRKLSRICGISTDSKGFASKDEAEEEISHEAERIKSALKVYNSQKKSLQELKEWSRREDISTN